MSSSGALRGIENKNKARRNKAKVSEEEPNGVVVLNTSRTNLRGERRGERGQVKSCAVLSIVELSVPDRVRSASVYI